MHTLFCILGVMWNKFVWRQLGVMHFSVCVASVAHTFLFCEDLKVIIKLGGIEKLALFAIIQIRSCNYVY